MSPWVNFKKLRESLDFAQVLRDYDVAVTMKGDQAMGFCPLPDHKGRTDRKSKSFSVNLKKGIFQCFGCQAKGNVLDFVALMEGLDPDNPKEFRKVALMLQERYSAGDVDVAPDRPVTGEPENAGNDNARRLVNAPLGFELKGLRTDHPYPHERGLSVETAKYFGLGFCEKGLMKGRLVIPLHDHEGRLIGYAGRLVYDAEIGEENPKYKLPGDRERDGTVCEFRKSEFLFNGHRLNAPLDDLVVVEGFFGAMWLHQAGYPNVVALMGASCSERQAALLVDLLQPGGRLWIMPDGDDAGKKCACSVLSAIAPLRFVRWVKLEDDQEPEDLGPEALQALFGPPLR